MNTKKIIKNVFIVFIMTVTFLMVSGIPAVANQNVEAKKQQTRAKINQLKKLEHNEKSKLVRNQQKLESVSNSLESSKKQYSSVQSQLSTMEDDLNDALYEFNTIDKQLKYRIRQVFKTQRVGMFELLLNAQDMNSLLDMIYFEKIIIKRDYDKMISAKTKAEKIAKLKKDIEYRKKYLAQSIKSINSQQRNLQYAINQNQSMINKLKTNRAYYEKTERELDKQSENIQNMISKSGTSSTVKTSSTGFMKPIGGRITSPFGWRTHPIFNSRTFHSGVDIGGPYRGNIVASNSGKVIYAGWYGGYGKVVILDHGVVNGSPITTLYAHMDSIKVKVGDYVNKGQVVGYEGTTGYSTGPHCHFEVRVNGKPNNPLNYI